MEHRGKKFFSLAKRRITSLLLVGNISKIRFCLFLPTSIVTRSPTAPSHNNIFNTTAVQYNITWNLNLLLD